MLIYPRAHDEDVFAWIVIGFLVLVGPLALIYGVDSRIDDVARRRGFRR